MVTIAMVGGVSLALAALCYTAGRNDADPLRGGDPGSRSSTDPDVSVVRVISAALQPNSFSVGASDLETKPNPAGEGRFVYVPQTRFDGTERLFVWLVIDEQGYPLNGAAKLLTPDLLWPREAEPMTWGRTGLGSGSGAIDYVFRGQTLERAEQESLFEVPPGIADDIAYASCKESPADVLGEAGTTDTIEAARWYSLGLTAGPLRQRAFESCLAGLKAN